MRPSTVSLKVKLCSILKKTGAGIAVAAFWLGVWHLLYLLVAREILLVSPVQAFQRLFELAGTPDFWRSVGSTCLRVLTGCFCALTASTLLASACARFRLVHRLFEPLIGMIRATPVVSFIILVLIWIKTDRIPIFVAFLMVVPMAWGNISAGIGEADRSLLEMARIFRLGRGKILRYIYIPAVLPYFISACSAGLGFAWKSAVAAEVIALPKYAVGRQLNNSKIYLETADLFAWSIAVIIISLLIERVAVALLRLLSKRLGAANNVQSGGGADNAADH